MRFDQHIADRITAIILFALGAAMAYGGFVMDRLEIRQIHPASIPGLTPMLLGAAMMVAALLLFAGARTPVKADAPSQKLPEGSWLNFCFAALLSCTFALFLIGKMPFAVATALYIFCFTALFTWLDSAAKRPGIATLLIVAAFAAATAFAVSTLFRCGFLVRLP